MIRRLANMGNANIFTALTMVLVVLTFGIKAITDAMYVAQGIDNTLVSSKYITALLACMSSAAAVRGKETRFVGEFSWLLLLFVSFSLLSFVEMLLTLNISSYVLNELFKLGMPILFSYFVLNTLDYRQIVFCMKWILAVSLVGYVMEVTLAGATLADALGTIDFGTSYSPLESSYSAGTSIMLCFFFCYYRKNKVCMILSVLFCMAVFKRLALVFALVAFLLPFFINMKKQVNPKTVGVLSVLFPCVALLYAWLLMPEQNWLFLKYLGQDQYQFSMGRSMTFDYLLSSGFESYGFGSANEVIKGTFGMPFEMDLIKVAIELTPIAMMLLVFVVLRISSCNRWGVFMAIYLLLNMLTSDSLNSNFSLALFYMTIGCMGAEQKDLAQQDHDAERDERRRPPEEKKISEGEGVSVWRNAR